MKIISYNIHKGFSVGNRRFVLDSIRHAIRATSADILFLQEVVGENLRPRKHQKDLELAAQFEYLADSVWPHFSYGKNSVYDKGHHGNAILSKYPIEQWENIDLTQNVPASQRGALYSLIYVGDRKVHLFCAHLGLLANERKRQVSILAQEIKSRVEPGEAVILAGDFNDWHHRISPTLDTAVGLKEVSQSNGGTIRQRFGSKPTFPARFPVLSLDRVYYRDLGLKTSTVLKGAPWNKLSDHCAIFAEFYSSEPSINSDHLQKRKQVV